MDKNMKLECMRRRQHVLFGIAGILIMVASFGIDFWHVSPLSLANASFLFHSRLSRCFANLNNFCVSLVT